MAGRAAAWMAGLVLAAGGCGVTPATGIGTAGPQRAGGELAVHARWESCAAAAPPPGPGLDDGQDALTLPVLDDRFQPVAAVVCRTVPRQRPSGGSDLVAVEDRADDVTALVATLRLPDEAPTTGACTMELRVVPWLALLDATGRWVRPGVPIDACRKPRFEFLGAYQNLRTARISTRVLREIESDAAVASGCSQQWADMVWVAGQMPGRRDATPGPLPAGDAQVRICIYRVPAREQGSGKPGGDFQSGGKLPAGRWAVIKRELDTAGPAGACRTPASRFAVLHPPAGLVYVEADGCRRVLIEGASGAGALRQAPAKLTSLVFDR